MSIIEAPVSAPSATEFALPSWTVAEFLDTPYADGLMLRAVICRLGPGRWQWSVMSIEDDRGEVISLGTEASIGAARRTAAGEIEKCIQDALSLD
jgi:hypothetical protein